MVGGVYVSVTNLVPVLNHVATDRGKSYVLLMMLGKVTMGLSLDMY